jgi:recombination protein RecR
MTSFPPPIDALISAFRNLPGIGQKTAERFVFHMLAQPKAKLDELASALTRVKTAIRSCEVCGTYTEASPCDICRDPGRDSGLICVVATSAEQLAIESTGEFKGRYHVLGGVLNPVEGITPEQLRVTPLLTRLKAGGVREVLIATNPDMEGEATALYLFRALEPLGASVTRLARGLPMGSDLEYADEVTLSNAIKGRRSMANGS